MSSIIRPLGLATSILAVCCPATSAQETTRVTILYDAFGPPSSLEKDWGFAALVEYGGKRILFDTGNNAGIFERNVRKLGIDLTRLDAAVISHRHSDHTSGLNYLLGVNPDIPIYTPQKTALFKESVPAGFLKPYADLPPSLHYFDGKAPEHLVGGTPWEAGHFQIVTQTAEIFPGIFVLTTTSEKLGTLEMNEVSLAIRTPKGLAVVVGCSHPGVEKILAGAARIDSRLYTVTGGFHLVLATEEEVRKVASILADELKVERVAPGHCTSELGFAVLLDRFKDRFDSTGLGAVLPLP